MQDGFNLKEWETAAKRFCNNKTNMDAKMSITIKEGKFLIRVVDMRTEFEKYKTELQKLALTVAQGGYIVAFNSLCKPAYPLEEDYEDEAAMGRQCMLENIIMYLNTLFDKGLEAFYCLLVTQRQLFECSYQIRHMKYDGEMGYRKRWNICRTAPGCLQTEKTFTVIWQLLYSRRLFINILLKKCGLLCLHFFMRKFSYYG